MSLRSALLMAWMPLPTASQCAIVVSVKAITKGRSIHAINRAPFMPVLRSTHGSKRRVISTPSGCPRMPCCVRRSQSAERPSLTKVKEFFEDFAYQAASWGKESRVIANIEWHPGELFPRVGFIVTNMPMELDRGGCASTTSAEQQSNTLRSSL